MHIKLQPDSGDLGISTNFQQILIKLVQIVYLESENKITAYYSAYNKDEVEEAGTFEGAYRNSLKNIPNQIVLTEDVNFNEVALYKKVKDYLISLGIPAEKITIVGKIEWRYENRQFRIIMDSSYGINSKIYAPFLIEVQEAGVPILKDNDLSVIYFEELLPEQIEMLKNDINVLFEEK